MWWSAWPGDHSLDWFENKMFCFLRSFIYSKKCIFKTKKHKSIYTLFLGNKKDKKSNKNSLF